jgi:hypothetical protein
MWEPQPLTTLRASKACRGENFTFTFTFIHILILHIHTYIHRHSQRILIVRKQNVVVHGTRSVLCISSLKPLLAHKRSDSNEQIRKKNAWRQLKWISVILSNILSIFDRTVNRPASTHTLTNVTATCPFASNSPYRRTVTQRTNMRTAWRMKLHRVLTTNDGGGGGGGGGTSSSRW